MKLTRHCTVKEETERELVFDLVVRDGRDQHTYGGKTVRVAKPFTFAKLREDVRNAVDEIVQQGRAEDMLRNVLAMENDNDDGQRTREA